MGGLNDGSLQTNNTNDSTVPCFCCSRSKVKEESSKWISELRRSSTIMLARAWHRCRQCATRCSSDPQAPCCCCGVHMASSQAAPLQRCVCVLRFTPCGTKHGKTALYVNRNKASQCTHYDRALAVYKQAATAGGLPCFVPLSDISHPPDTHALRRPTPTPLPIHTQGATGAPGAAARPAGGPRRHGGDAARA